MILLSLSDQLNKEKFAYTSRISVYCIRFWIHQAFKITWANSFKYLSLSRSISISLSLSVFQPGFALLLIVKCEKFPSMTRLFSILFMNRYWTYYKTFLYLFKLSCNLPLDCIKCYITLTHFGMLYRYPSISGIISI